MNSSCCNDCTIHFHTTAQYNPPFSNLLALSVAFPFQFSQHNVWFIFFEDKCWWYHLQHLQVMWSANQSYLLLKFKNWFNKVCLLLPPLFKKTKKPQKTNKQTKLIPRFILKFVAYFFHSLLVWNSSVIKTIRNWLLAYLLIWLLYSVLIYFL